MMDLDFCFLECAHNSSVGGKLEHRILLSLEDEFDWVRIGVHQRESLGLLETVLLLSCDELEVRFGGDDGREDGQSSYLYFEVVAPVDGVLQVVAEGPFFGCLVNN